MGDDVRRLDPAASARTGIAHVREHVPERALTTWVLLDVSASMAFGTAARLKSDVAAGVTEVVGRLAVRRAGRVALLTFGAEVQALLPPRGGRHGLVALRRAVAAGVAPDNLCLPTKSVECTPPAADALALGLRRVMRLARGPGLVVVVSDFREGAAPARGGGERAARPPWTRALSALTGRHDVLAVEVVDPREAALPDAGQLTLVDPETGARLEIDTASAELRRAFASAELARRDELKAALRRARARHVTLSTNGDWLRALGRSLR